MESCMNWRWFSRLKEAFQVVSGYDEIFEVFLRMFRTNSRLLAEEVELGGGNSLLAVTKDNVTSWLCCRVWSRQVLLCAIYIIEVHQCYGLTVPGKRTQEMRSNSCRPKLQTDNQQAHAQEYSAIGRSKSLKPNEPSLILFIRLCIFWHLHLATSHSKYMI